MKTKLFLMLLVAAGLSALAVAADITIEDAGFEVKTRPDGDFGWLYPSQAGNHWLAADPDALAGGNYESIGTAIFPWNPGTEDMTGWNKWRSQGFGGEAPEGDNVMVADNRNSGVANLLAETFDHTQTYRLTALVAIPPAYVGIGVNYGWGTNTPSYWKGYGLELLVGGTVVGGRRGTVEGGTSIAKITKTAAECIFAPDTFYEVSLTYTPDEADAALDGQPIQIRLMGGEPLDGERTFACFDDVHLKTGQLNAGPDIASWSGAAATTAAVFDEPLPSSILWTADPNSDPNFTVEISDPTAPNPTVTVNKLNELAPEVLKIRMFVLADGEIDSMVINVYDTPCLALVAAGLNAQGDLNDDCNTDIHDLAIIAASWLLNTEQDGWMPK